MQRDAIENDHRLELLERLYEKEKKEVEQKMTEGMEELRRKYSREYRLRNEHYDKEIAKLEGKIEKASRRYEVGTKKGKDQVETLRLAAEKSQEK